ncbi:hypothetical protein V8C26DRAFT_386752 [Trichoderma gracile]
MSNTFPDQDSPLMLDPIEFWSSSSAQTAQTAPKRPSSAASHQRLSSVRSASMDRDDPLHAAPLAQFKPPSLPSSSSSLSSSSFSEARQQQQQQSRVAVVLKKAPAYHSSSSRSHKEGGNGTAATASSKAAFSSSQQAGGGGPRVMKKETPVPIPRPFGSTSTATAAATPSSLHTPVPLPRPMASMKTVTQRAAQVVSPTPVPLPKQLTTTPADPPTNANVTTKPATTGPTPVRSQAPPLHQAPLHQSPLHQAPLHQASAQTPVPTPPQTRISVQIPAPTPPPPPPPGPPQPSSGRGRPKGWKPGMSYSSLRGGPASARPAATTAGRPGRPAKPKQPIITPSSSSLGHAKRRGRPPKAPSPLPWQVYRSLQTSFVAFLCEWSGCKAELHNLDTLRRHVHVVHCRRAAPYVCRWGTCAQTSASSEGEEFPDEPSLQEHVEEAHLVPFSWHVGDGPRNSGGPVKHPLEDDEIPGYLKDEQGNQVTPSVRDQQVEDFATFKQNRQKLKDLLFQMNENLPSEESDSPIDED